MLPTYDTTIMSDKYQGKSDATTKPHFFPTVIEAPQHSQTRTSTVLIKHRLYISRKCAILKRVLFKLCTACKMSFRETWQFPLSSCFLSGTGCLEATQRKIREQGAAQEVHTTCPRITMVVMADYIRQSQSDFRHLYRLYWCSADWVRGEGEKTEGVYRR